MERQPQYLLALEGGGTRCQAALFDRAGRLWQTSEAGPVNTNFVPVEQAQQAVRQAVTGVLAAAQAPAAAVCQLATALVAAGFEAEALHELLPNAAYRRYDELAVVFARAGIYQPHGVAVVAATGCTAQAMRADDGRTVTLGGWGSLLGDEGSAYALGVLGLRAAVLAFEGRAAAPTALVEAVSAHFHLSLTDFQTSLIELAYQKPLSRTEIAGLAPVVSDLAGRGDALAAEITQQVAGDLAALMLHAARRLFQREEQFDVVLAGGLVNAGSVILGPVAQRLRAEFPNASMQIGWEAPAVALGRLALQQWQEAVC